MLTHANLSCCNHKKFPKFPVYNYVAVKKSPDKSASSKKADQKMKDRPQEHTVLHQYSWTKAAFGAIICIHLHFCLRKCYHKTPKCSVLRNSALQSIPLLTGAAVAALQAHQHSEPHAITASRHTNTCRANQRESNGLISPRADFPKKQSQKEKPDLSLPAKSATVQSVTQFSLT